MQSQVLLQKSHLLFWEVKPLAPCASKELVSFFFPLSFPCAYQSFLYSGICPVIIPRCLCFRHEADFSPGCRINLALGSNLTLCSTPSPAEASEILWVLTSAAAVVSGQSLVHPGRVSSYNLLTNLFSDLCEFGNGINWKERRAF